MHFGFVLTWFSFENAYIKKLKIQTITFYMRQQFSYEADFIDDTYSVLVLFGV